mmetsp:Transcript_12578/g.30002  ORF Transcript_12578/g.30002 Transcript_12578/m.30002 type:complete len:222 (+) Transcript_12578:1143-1808(+)
MFCVMRQKASRIRFTMVILSSRQAELGAGESGSIAGSMASRMLRRSSSLLAFAFWTSTCLNASSRGCTPSSLSAAHHLFSSSSGMATSYVAPYLPAMLASYRHHARESSAGLSQGSKSASTFWVCRMGPLNFFSKSEKGTTSLFVFFSSTRNWLLQRAHCQMKVIDLFKSWISQYRTIAPTTALTVAPQVQDNIRVAGPVLCRCSGSAAFLSSSSRRTAST